MTGNFNNKKESKPLSHKALRVSGGGYKPYKINDLAECADAQFSASFEPAQDSAVIIADFEECKVECTECVQSPNIILRNLRDVILKVKPEGSYCHPCICYVIR